jgi:hypothetical protein
MTMSQPETPWLRDLYRVLQDEARDDTMQCLKVAVLVAARMPRAEIARRLDVEPKAVEQAIRRLRVAQRRLDGGEQPTSEVRRRPAAVR